MTRYEVIRIQFDGGDLGQINRYAGDGWMVCGCWTERDDGEYHYAMLQRPLPPATPGEREGGWGGEP